MTDIDETNDSGDSDEKCTPDDIRLAKEIWDRAVQTQMHFNEMSVMSRRLGLSFVVAALGLGVLLLTQGGEVGFIKIPIPCIEMTVSTHAAGLLVLIAAVGLLAVQHLDLGVYHKMLRGSVTFGEELEKRVLRDKAMKTPMGMTEFISLYSRYEKVGGPPEYKPEGEKKSAETKIKRFYRFSFWSLVVIGLLLVIAYGDSYPRDPEQHPVANQQKNNE